MGEVVHLPLPARPSLDLRAAMSELEPEQQYVLAHRWAIGRSLLSDEEIASRLSLDIEVVWEIHDAALRTLGFLWLTEVLLPYYLPHGEVA